MATGAATLRASTAPRLRRHGPDFPAAAYGRRCRIKRRLYRALYKYRTRAHSYGGGSSHGYPCARLWWAVIMISIAVVVITAIIIIITVIIITSITINTIITAITIITIITIITLITIITIITIITTIKIKSSKSQ